MNLYDWEIKGKNDLCRISVEQVELFVSHISGSISYYLIIKWKWDDDDWTVDQIMEITTKREKALEKAIIIKNQYEEKIK